MTILPKTIPGSMSASSFPEMENLIGSVVSDIISFRRNKTLLVYIIGLFSILGQFQVLGEEQ